MWNFRKKCGTLGKYVEFFTVFGFPSLILYWLHNTSRIKYEGNRIEYKREDDRQLPYES